MTDERIFAYLLGELPEEEAERFEEECFAGEDWPDQIRPAEDDLIDAYLRGELAPEQRQHFEQNYLTTEARVKRVAMAAGLLRYINTRGAEEKSAPAREEPTWIKSFIAFWGGRNWALRAGLAVGVAAVILGGVWLFRARTRSPRVVATLTLTINAGDNRAEGAQPEMVKLPPGAEALRVILKLPGHAAAAAYRVELLNEGGEASTPRVVGHDAESVTVEIPAAQLTHGEYALRLFAVRPDGAEERIRGVYLFSVE